MNKEEMIAEILLVCKANSVPNSGDIFLSLAFRTESELKSICHELHINTER